MTNSELLKAGRNRLLSLHKLLVDFERSVYEGMHGQVTSGQFLNVLLEDPDFSWLRKFSTLIVDIDEMFAQKDGFSEDAVTTHLAKMRELVEMKIDDKDFVARYRNVLQRDTDAGAEQGELKMLLS